MSKNSMEPNIVHIRVNEGIINTNGLSNAISTTKYNIITWLPKSLLEQFRRVANIYFVCISILMFIGTYAQYIFVTPLNPFSTLFTLFVVLMVTSVKEGLEDYARARSDKEENTRMITIVTFSSNGNVIETQKESRFVKAGDIVKLTGLISVPVDMVLILTSMYQDGNQCYIETSNIDGETNLKLKEAPSLLSSLAMAGNGKPTPELFNGKLEVEPPNKNIHNFVGALHIANLSEPIPLGPENLLLRSSLFSNTDWAYAVAVYTGQETKIQMNNRHAPSKMSKLEGYLNRAIVLIFCAQVTLVIFSVASIYFLGVEYEAKLPYVYVMNADTSVLPLWAELIFVFFLLYNNFIPISLYVTIELVNLGQAFMIGNDNQLYEESLNLPCIVRSSNLVQELGMVSNIFSDKTGTLTRNEMKFVKFVVNGQLYNVSEQEFPRVMQTLQQPSKSSSSSSSSSSSLLYDFLQCLSACHTVIREKDGTYRAESPDELALLQGVGSFQCSLKDRGTAGMNIEMLGM